METIFNLAQFPSVCFLRSVVFISTEIDRHNSLQYHHIDVFVIILANKNNLKCFHSRLKETSVTAQNNGLDCAIVSMFQ